MSYTSVYKLYKTKVSCIEELRNGHGSGPAIWDYISLKLYGKKMSIFEQDKNFWSSYKDQRLSEDEKAVLLSTYDYAYVGVDDLERFSAACKTVHKLILDKTDWDWSHFEKIGEISKCLSKKHDHRCRGLCIGCTSVSDPWEFEDVKNLKSWNIYRELNKTEAA